VGTRVQRFKEYDPKYRLVVRGPDGHRRMYTALTNPDAQTGADYFDLTGLVIRARLDEPCNDTPDVSYSCASSKRAVNTRRDLDLVTALIEQGRIDGAPDWTDAGTYLLTLDFMDGSQDSLLIDANTGLTAQGIQIPLLALRSVFGLSGGG
jgi:hypothetical protein